MKFLKIKKTATAAVFFFTLHSLLFTLHSAAEYNGNYFSVYFTRYNTTTEPYTTESNANNLAHLQAAADLISGAKSTIDMAAYELNEPVIVNALKAAAASGVTVKVILGPQNAASDTYLGTQISSQVWSSGNLMHNKYMIVDSTRIWTGSTNFTPEGFHSNTNNSILLRDCPELIANYEQDFTQMWNHSKTSHPITTTVDGVTINNYFSPKDNSVSTHLTSEVTGTSRSVLFLITFGITQSDLLNAMYNKWDSFKTTGSGVLEGVISRTARSPYTTWDTAGMDVRNHAETGQWLHSKVMIIDTSKVVTGSTNWSKAGNESNDENMLIIDDPVLACAYLREFRRIYDNTTDEDTAASTKDSPSRPAALTGLGYYVTPKDTDVVIGLSWSEPSESEFGRYYVYVETYDFSPAVYNTLPTYASVTDRSQTSFSFERPGNTTFYCMVDYVSNFGVESATHQVLSISPTPAEAVTTLSGLPAGLAGDISLSWISPHEFKSDPASGACNSYIIKYATGVFSNFNDDITNRIDISTAPQAPGSVENFTVNFPDGINYIAVFAKNRNSVISEISNLISAQANDSTPPSPISDLVVARTGPDGLYLTWTMPGDNGDEGTVDSCDIIYASNSSFVTASTVTASDLSSGPKNQVIQSLSEYTRYWIKVIASDEAGNTSSSTAVSCYTGQSFISVPDFSGAVNVSTSPKLDVSFKIEIDTLTSGSPGASVELWDMRDNLGGCMLAKLPQSSYTVAPSTSARGFTVSPSLSYNHRYALVVSSSLKDIDGKTMLTRTTYYFITVCSPSAQNVFISECYSQDNSSVTVEAGQFSSPGYVVFDTAPISDASISAAYTLLSGSYTVSGSVKGFRSYPGDVTALVPSGGGIPYYYDSASGRFEKAASQIISGKTVFEVESPAVWLFVAPDSFSAKKAQGIYAYPVPCYGGSVTFANMPGAHKIGIYTISGRTVYSGNVTGDPVNNEWKWEFSGVAPGLYFWVADGSRKGLLMLKRR